MSRKIREERSVNSPLSPIVNPDPPLLIGDAIHVLNQQVHRSVVLHDDQTLARLVLKQLGAGAQALAVNLGPGKEMRELTPWVVDTIREHTDVPLFVSANIIDQKQVLTAHGRHIVINAVTSNRDELTKAFAAARDAGSSLVVLLVQSGKVTVGIDGRIQLAAEVLEQAVSCSFPLTSLYLDPVLSCRPDPVAWQISRGLPDVGSVLETISLIKQLDGRIKTIVALANGSEGMGRKVRGGIHSRMLSLLAGAGLDAVLLNCFDRQVMRTAAALQNSKSLNVLGLPYMEQVSSAA